jgi:hypothetical protein
MENQPETSAGKPTKLELVIMATGIISSLASIVLILDWMLMMPQNVFIVGGIVFGIAGLIVGGNSIKPFKTVARFTATTFIKIIVSFFIWLIAEIVIGVLLGGFTGLGALIGGLMGWKADKKNKDNENISKLTQTGMRLCAIGVFFIIIDILIP